MSFHHFETQQDSFWIRRATTVRIAVGVLLLLHTVMLGWMAWRYSPTIDEPAHLVAGLSHWKFGRFDLYRVNPPLVRLVATLPMLCIDPIVDWSASTDVPHARPEFAIGNRFANLSGFDVFWHVTLCRWACIPFSLLGGWICFRWARDLYGHAAGILALTLWCFCPNILGNGSLMTPDVPAAACGAMAAYYFWRWLREPGWPRALIAGLTLGLAELTKSTWIILFALWPLLWVIWRVSASGLRERILPRSAIISPLNETDGPSTLVLHRRSSIPQLATILILALYIMNLGYGFENSFQRLEEFQFISRSFGGAVDHTQPANRFADTWLGTLPVPLPGNYLRGLDVQRYDFEVGNWSYLRGEQKMGGWWYYYLYAMAVKMPAGTLFLIALAALLSVERINAARRKPTSTAPNRASRINEHDDRSCFLDNVTLLAPAVILIILVSSQTGFNRYLRYVLPAFPFVFIWIGKVARVFTVQRNRRTREPTPMGRLVPILHCRPSIRVFRSIPVLLPLTAMVASSLAVIPHSLSYFNEFAGGSENGPTHLLDGNIDWGQDLLELKRWCDAHPDKRPLCLAYFGPVAPRTADIECVPIPRSISALKGKVVPDGLVSPSTSVRGFHAPAWYALSVNDLYGYRHDGYEDDRYARFKAQTPVARAGYSIRIYSPQ